ncbi:MAG: hypothetical protein AB2A00_22435 [Myxococcota bacterium]
MLSGCVLAVVLSLATLPSADNGGAATSSRANAEAVVEPRERPGDVIPVLAAVGAGTVAFLVTTTWGGLLGALLGPLQSTRPFILETSRSPSPALTDLAAHSVMGMALSLPVAGLALLFADGLTWALVTLPRGRAITLRPLLFYVLAAVACVPVAAGFALIAGLGMVSLRWEGDRLERNRDKLALTAALGGALGVWLFLPLWMAMSMYIRLAAGWALVEPDERMTFPELAQRFR